MARAPGRNFGSHRRASLVMAFDFAVCGEPGASFVRSAGAAVAILWVALSRGVTYACERRSSRPWLIENGSQALAPTLMGGPLGVWK